MIPVGGLVNVYGKPKTGKSFVVLGMAQAITNGDETWEGFDVDKHGPVAYLQVDTPREEWAKRLETAQQMSHTDDIPFYVADMWLIPKYPMDILEPDGQTLKWLKDEMERVQPIMVVIDTLREVHSGDEDSSTTMRNVITNIVGACMPSQGSSRSVPAIVLISHARKDAAGWQQDGQDDMMDQARGSSYVAGRMDVIIQVTQRTMKFKGRATGEQRRSLFKNDQTGWVHVVQEDDGSQKHVQEIMERYPDASVNSNAARLVEKMGYSMSTATRRINQWIQKHRPPQQNP